MYTDICQNILKKDCDEKFSCDNHVIYYKISQGYAKAFKKQDAHIRLQILKHMDKALEAPERQQYMSTTRKGQIEMYFDNKRKRIYYRYDPKENLVEFLEFSHKKKQ